MTLTELKSKTVEQLIAAHIRTLRQMKPTAKNRNVYLRELRLLQAELLYDLDESARWK